MSMLGAADLNLFLPYLIGKGQQNPINSSCYHSEALVVQTFNIIP